MTFETIQYNFKRKLWNAKQVAMAVAKGVITPEEYKKITGNTYPGT